MRSGLVESSVVTVSSAPGANGTHGLPPYWHPIDVL